MHRIRQLQQIWNWLPAFRVVAETEHLPTAAREAGVTPSALSHAVKGLESELGIELFHRRGRGLALNGHGQQLLASLRESMRRLDDEITRLRGRAFQGPLRIAGPAPFAAAYVLPVLMRLGHDHPGLRPSLVSVSAGEANTLLLDGRLDLAVLDEPTPTAQLMFEKLSPLSYGVYAGADHPLAKARRITPNRLLEHPFVAPAGGGDHWPIDWPRVVALRVDELFLGMQVCAQGELLALLPDVVVETTYPEGKALSRLPIDVPTEAPLYLVRRPPLGSSSLIDRVAAELKAGSAAGQPRRRSSARPGRARE